MLPKELKYSSEHEWIKIDGKKIIVGITDYAQKELGDVVFVDLPAIGERFTARSALATIESVTTMTEMHAPVSGEVLETNDGLEHSPEWVNQDPYGKGWVAVLEPSEPAELKSLLDAAAYSAITEKK